MKSLVRFGSAASTVNRGREGEKAARSWLSKQGFEIVTTNFRTKPGEIDLIAKESEEDGECLCFIEIKARSSDRFGSALAAVPAAKQRRIARAASIFLISHPWDGPCRFDVLGIEKASDGWQFQLIRDAYWCQPER